MQAQPSKAPALCCSIRRKMALCVCVWTLMHRTRFEFIRRSGLLWLWWLISSTDCPKRLFLNIRPYIELILESVNCGSRETSLKPLLLPDIALEFCVMPFGLRTAYLLTFDAFWPALPSNIWWVMPFITSHFIDRFLIVYLDYILVYS